MAPLKFEEHIKDKLDERRIKPSVKTWDQISNKLGNSSATKKQGNIWYAIAASVIGLLIASAFFFSYQDDNGFKENQVVVDKEEKEVLKLKKITPAIILKDLEENNFVETNTIQVEGFKKTDLKSTEVAQIKTNNDKELVMAVGSTSTAVDEFTKTNLVRKEALINAKIDELVAQVDSLELNNTTVSDVEIEALLRKAQNEILEQKIFRNSTTVDAMALLSEAEEELDLSLRDQLFETLKSGYLKVKTAVADRNN